MNAKHWKSEAKKRNVEWATVQETYRLLRAELKLAKEPEIEIRKTVWDQYAWTEGCRDFWRVGMFRKFPEVFEGGDVAGLPGFDGLATEIYTRHPWVSDDADRPADAIFALIAKPYEPLPTADQTMAEVFELIDSGNVAGSIDDQPF